MVLNFTGNGIKVHDQRWLATYGTTAVVYTEYRSPGPSRGALAVVDMDPTQPRLSSQDAADWMQRQTVFDTVELHTDAQAYYLAVHAEVPVIQGQPVYTYTPLSMRKDPRWLTNTPIELARKHELALLDFRIEAIKNAERLEHLLTLLRSDNYLDAWLMPFTGF